LPPSLTHLTFGSHFNQPIDHLPPSLIHLTLDFQFNQNVNNLPPALTHLKFSLAFRKEIAAYPSSLQVLELGHWQDFNFNFFPDSIHTLQFQSLEEPIYHFPASLTSLTFLAKFPANFFPTTLIPPKLTHYHGDIGYFNTLPPSLTHLSLHVREYDREQLERISTLPSLLELELTGENFYGPLPSLPPSLSKLSILCSKFNSLFLPLLFSPIFLLDMCLTKT
jgi:hypothetical protein